MIKTLKDLNQAGKRFWSRDTKDSPSEAEIRGYLQTQFRNVGSQEELASAGKRKFQGTNGNTIERLAREVWNDLYE